MSTLALALAVLVLLTRLPLLFLERPVKGWEAALSWAFQAISALVLTRGLHADTALAVTILGIAHATLHLAWWKREQPKKKDFESLRIAVSLLLLLLVVVLGSPWSGLEARDYGPLLLAWSRVFSPSAPLARAPWRTILSVTAGLLLCVNEANALIRWTIDYMNLRPKEAPPKKATGLLLCVDEANALIRLTIDPANLTPKEAPPKEATETHNAKEILASGRAEEEYKRGRLIGALERVIIFTLMLGAQYGAIAFVLTAKTMARFKTLEEKEFAEYFLAGTLMSVVLAGVAGLAVKNLLGM